MSETLASSYSVHGACLKIYCATEKLQRLVNDYLVDFFDSSDKRPDINIELFSQSRDYMVPTGARLFMRFWTLKGYVWQDTYYFTDYLSYMIIGPGGREVKGYISDDTFNENGERFFTHILLHFTLLEALRNFQLYPLHSAALESPQGSGFMFPANGYSGKTSITLLLASLGFRYLSDDTVFLRPDGGKISVLPFRRHFHIPGDFISDFPELKCLGDLPEPSEPLLKRSFPAEKIFPGLEMDIMVNPEWIFFPTITGAERTSVQPIKSSEALSILLPQSLEVMFNPDIAKDHLTSLRLLLENARCFRMLSGRDIHKDPKRLLEVLEAAQGISVEKD